MAEIRDALVGLVSRVVQEALEQHAVRMVELTRGTVQEVVLEALGAPRLPTPRRGRPPKALQAMQAPSPGCFVKYCPNPYRSQGYCAAHYQAARKYEWPMPCPPDWNAPPRPARGRPPKITQAARTVTVKATPKWKRTRR